MHTFLRTHFYVHHCHLCPFNLFIDLMHCTTCGLILQSPKMDSPSNSFWMKLLQRVKDDQECKTRQIKSLFIVPHSTMALPDVTGLYLALTHSSCCWEYLPRLVGICVGERWRREELDFKGGGGKERGRKRWRDWWIYLQSTLLESIRTAHMQLFCQFCSFHL